MSVVIEDIFNKDLDLPKVRICFISGVKGLVLDTNNNTVTNATLTIAGREFAKFRSNSDGAYFRLVMPGTYQIQV